MKKRIEVAEVIMLLLPASFPNKKDINNETEQTNMIGTTKEYANFA